MQTLVLVICDAVAGRDRTLSFLAGTLVPVFEALLTIITVSVTIAGGLLRTSVSIGGVVSPASVVIVALWVGGLLVIKRVRNQSRWQAHAPSAHPGRPHRRVAHPDESSPYQAKPTRYVVATFAGCSAVTLGAGVVLADAGNELAGRAGINGVIFGATCPWP